MENRKILKNIGVGLVCILVAVLFVGYFIGLGHFDELDNPYAAEGCNVAGVILQGDLYTHYDAESQAVDDAVASEDITYFLEQAEGAPNISAILLEIDSYGGSPVAAQEIVDTLKKFVTTPVVAQIRGAGLSAAYWVASGADYIFASALSDVGSIGVTQSYIDESEYNQKQGYIYNRLNTAKFKDILDPQKPLTLEERELLQRDLDIVHAAFVAGVATNRGLSVEDVEKLADGSFMLGQMALENGLIDEVGGYYEVKNYLREKLGIEPEICW